MEVHKKLENGRSETHYICDGCGSEIDRKHMRNSAENRDSRQLNVYDNFGNVSHYCRRCSGIILEEMQKMIENRLLYGDESLKDM